MLSFERNTWNNVFIPIDPLDQWAWDVRAWFESSFLMIRQSLLIHVTGVPTPWPKSPGVREKLCGRILLLDGDYTNINFSGFVLTLAAVAVVSGFSHLAYLKQAATAQRKRLGIPFRLFLRLCSRIPGLYSGIRRGIQVRSGGSVRRQRNQESDQSESTRGDTQDTQDTRCELELSPEALPTPSTGADT